MSVIDLIDGRLGVHLVRWLRSVGRDDEAVHTAHRLGLITDADLIAAWNTGTDVLCGLVTS